jgi:hypothetical protein
MRRAKTYPLRLPRSLKRAVELQSREDGTSINQFVATAVAEKISALQTAEFFASRRARADFKAFDKLMKRRGGTPPREGDEIDGSVLTSAGLTPEAVLATLPKARKRVFAHDYKKAETARKPSPRNSGSRERGK